jgi:tetratricopeptide (TPR) repeat protein
LIETTTGTHLFADHFDDSLENPLEVQDRVAVSVVGIIEPALEDAEIRRSTDSLLSDLTAYDLYLRSLPLVRAWTKDSTIRAMELLGQAVERDPYYGLTLALAAFCRLQLASGGWAVDFEATRRSGIELARRAAEAAHDDPNVLVQVAAVLGFFGEDIDTSIATIDHAISLNPTSTYSWFWSGWVRLYSGHPNLAVDSFATSLRLDPRSTLRPFHLAGIGIAHFFEGRYDQAATDFLASLHQRPSFPTTLRFLAACYAHMRRLEEAREVVNRLRSITPVVIPAFLPYRAPEHRELLLSGLRLVMGEAE